mmetsp:Transcript_32515/g.107189  ORF Transcript_32515/g.107189 Transcript_32515/m.107189 type:complete len:209 (-) Transcript_32515:134-760(-)
MESKASKYVSLTRSSLNCILISSPCKCCLTNFMMPASPPGSPPGCRSLAFGTPQTPFAAGCTPNNEKLCQEFCKPAKNSYKHLKVVFGSSKPWRLVLPLRICHFEAARWKLLVLHSEDKLRRCLGCCSASSSEPGYFRSCWLRSSAWMGPRSSLCTSIDSSQAARLVSSTSELRTLSGSIELQARRELKSSNAANSEPTLLMLPDEHE